MATTTSPQTNACDMALSRQLFGEYFASPEKLPVSYVYAGKDYRGLPKNSAVTRRFLDANMVETVIEGVLDEARGVTVRAECLTYRDYPVVEWTVYFSVRADGVRSARLSRLRAIDTVFAGGNPVLVHNNGDFCTEEGYTVTHLPLAEGVCFTQAPERGRSCDHAFPYQRLLFADFGLSVSIGWPGRWCCAYTGQEDGVALTAGQEIVDTCLEPGETFRSPRMTLLAFTGDEIRGINLWRRFFNAHVTPRSKGQRIAPISVSSENVGGVEFTEATEQNQIEGIACAKQHVPDLDVWWIDAGWYPCLDENGKPEWGITGTWVPDPARFPNGLGPVGKACRDAGMDLLVWFEPERVRPSTAIAKEHPEWLVYRTEKPEDPNIMLNLAIPACRRWLTDTISQLIEESGIGIYRQDCNFALNTIWRCNETDDRQGMLENQYIQGYLAYWDELLLRHPDLWIDSCASGGRRNDMETMRRSVPLHPTDYGYGYHHVNQAFRHTLHAWIPYTRGWAQSWDKDNVYYDHSDYYMADEISFDNYKMINGFAAMTGFGGAFDMKAAADQMPYLRKLHAIWKKFSCMALDGDFYALTENHRDFTKWTVFQFDMPETGGGAFQVLRNNQSPDDAQHVMPQGFEAGVTYALYNEETGQRMEKTGEDIRQNGLTFTQPVRSGAIWFYQRAEASNAKR